jgi:hypothetical protein
MLESSQHPRLDISKKMIKSLNSMKNSALPSEASTRMPGALSLLRKRGPAVPPVLLEPFRVAFFVSYENLWFAAPGCAKHQF